MSAIPSHKLPVGYKLQNYRILDVLGEGGFGITYLAQDEVLEQKVAIKEYFPASLTGRDQQTLAVHALNDNSAKIFQWGLDRFLSEARILAQLSHPNIVRVLYFTSLNNTGYMVMQYEEGEPLDKWIKHFPDNRLPKSELVRLIEPITQALQVVHDLGIAHRDVKPANIYIRSNGTPVLLDFGAARNTVSGRSQTVAAIVSAGYSPIEQYSDVAEQGPWTDIYATAGVAYRLVTGQIPTDAPSRIDAELAGKPDPCRTLANEHIEGYDRPFLAAIDKALSLRAKDRPQSIEEWRRQLGFEHGSASDQARAPGAAAVPAGAAPLAETVLFERPAGRPPPPAAAGAPEGAFAETVLLGREADGRTPPGAAGRQKKSSGGVMAAATLVLLAAAAGGGWYVYKTYLDTSADAIGNTPDDAFDIGTLTPTGKTVSDRIGGDDGKDVVRFALERARIVSFDTAELPSGAEAAVLGSGSDAPPEPLRDGTRRSYNLAAGEHFLEITSSRKDESAYDLALAAAGLTPDTGAEGAPPVLALAGTTPVERSGILWANGEERTYMLRADDTVDVDVTFSANGAQANLNLIDPAGLGVGRIDGETGGRTLRARLPAGDNQVIATSRQDAPFTFDFTVVPSQPEAKSFAKSTLEVPGWQSKEQAEALARNRTRLALVSGGRPVATDEAASMKALEMGIAYDADWKTTWKGQDEVTATLEARVRRVERPEAIEAGLSAVDIVAMEPFDVTLTSKASQDLSVGIFAWGADSSVVRVFPLGVAPEPIALAPGATRRLSEKVDQLVSAPLPGERESREAVIVVGCPTSKPAKFTELAPPAGANVGQSISAAIGEEAFFDKLSEFCPGELTVRVLPYTVTAETEKVGGVGSGTP